MRDSNYKKSLIKANLKSHWLFYIILLIGIFVFMNIGGVYATTTISDSSILTSILNATADVYSQNMLNLTIPYYLATNGTFVSTNLIWNQLGNGTMALGTEPKAYNGTLAAWLGLANGTVALNNGTWINLATLNNGSYFAWGNLGNGTYASWNQLGNGTMALNSTLGNIANWNTAYTLGTNNTFAGLNSTWVSWAGVSNATIRLQTNTTFTGLNSTQDVFSWFNRNLSMPFTMVTNNTFAGLNSTWVSWLGVSNGTIQLISNLSLSAPANRTSMVANFTDITAAAALPACGAAYNGSMARNDSGVWGCQSTGTWKLLY